MIDRFGEHRFDDGDAIGDAGGVRQQFADLRPGRAVAVKLEATRGHRKTGLTTGHRRQPLAIDNRFGQILVEEIVHLRFVVEEVHLRWGPRHEEGDDPFDLRRVMRLQQAARSSQRSQVCGWDITAEKR